MNTELSLEISNGKNQKVIRLFDTSYYGENETIENYLIEVLPVNKDRWSTFVVSKGFSLVLNSSNLRYKKAVDNDGLINLLDGIYEIKQSIKPNPLTISHYYYFRITELINNIEKERADLLKEKCDISRQEYWRNRDRLRDIEEYANAAKWIVEECGDKEKGKEMYQFAKKLLEQYTNECQC